MKNSKGKRILLIDKQANWRKRSATALRKIGFEVEDLEDYHYPPIKKQNKKKPYDLVILGCARIGSDEQDLITDVLNHREHLMVLLTKLSWPTMRAVFLAGANDVTDKPYNSDRLIDIVNQALETISLRDSYKKAEQKEAV